MFLFCRLVRKFNFRYYGAVIRREGTVYLILDNTVFLRREAVADKDKINNCVRTVMVEESVEGRIILGILGGKFAVPENTALNHINIAVLTLIDVEISRYKHGTVELCGKLIYEPYAVLSGFLAHMVKMSVHRNESLAALLVKKLCPRCDSRAF